MVVALTMTEKVEPRIYIKFCQKLDGTCSDAKAKISKRFPRSPKNQGDLVQSTLECRIRELKAVLEQTWQAHVPYPNIQ